MTENHPPPREALEAAESMMERIDLWSPHHAAHVKQDLARAFARYHAERLRRMADHDRHAWTPEQLMAEAARHAPEAEGE